MNNNSSIIRQGYVGEGQLLEPLAMRPYLNKQGVPVVAERVGMKLNNGKFVPEYRERRVYTQALLRKYEWEMIDAEVLDVMRQPLIGVNDLLSGGLTHNVGDVGVSISTYEQLSDMSDADISMSLTPKKGEGDRVEFTPVSIPIPIISKPFTLDLRTLAASRRGNGEALDVTQARTATRKVREAVEEMLFNGSSLAVQSFAIYGYTTQPKRSTGAASAYGGADWSTADGNAHKTIVGMIQALVNLGATGPFGLYVNNTQYGEIQHLNGSGNTAESQLSTILRTIPDLKFVHRAPRLDDGEAVLVQMTKETVDLAIGMDVTPVSWQEYGGMVNEFRVMTAVVPRVKYDANDSCAVAHVTGI